MLRKCVFPAAGYGTRFLPATKAMPKEMLPIVNKPLIQYGVEEAIDAGMSEIVIVSGRGKRAIEDHFDISYELEHQIAGTSKESLLTDIREVLDACNFTYTRQKEMKGLGHAVLTARNMIGDEAFSMVLADDLCINPGGRSIMGQMTDLYEKYKCSIVAVQEVPADQTKSYGIIDGVEIEEGVIKVSQMVEKPEPEHAPSNMAIIGRYILTPDIFDQIENTPAGKNGEVQITDAIAQQAREGRVLGYKFQGRRFDCGSIEGFVEATNFVFDQYYKQ
jgi:UTP--glucose-1-phosphate uridylyltransferase